MTERERDELLAEIVDLLRGRGGIPYRDCAKEVLGAIERQGWRLVKDGGPHG